jgi:hypothetical protein
MAKGVSNLDSGAKNEHVPAGSYKSRSKITEMKKESDDIKGLVQQIKVRRQLQPLQIVAFSLLKWVGAAITVTLLIILIYSLITLPRIPYELPLTASGEIDPQKLDAIKVVSTVSMDRFKDMVDVLVLRIMLPIFTTILGYLFGRQDERNSDELG